MLTSANANVDADTIVFSPAVTGTLALTSGALSISNTVTLSGPGASVLTISASNASRIFTIANGATVSIDGLKLTDGTVSGDGGAILNGTGALTLSNCVLSGNLASSEGGALFNNGGDVTISNSIVSGNSATDCGGFRNWYGVMTLTNSTVADNKASRYVGGICNNRNTSGAVLKGTLTVTNSTVSGNIGTDNYGGGIHNAEGILTVTNSTVSGNSTRYSGGGVYSDGALATVKITNSTVVGNASNYNGSGGGGIYMGGGSMRLANTLVAGNAVVTTSGTGKEGKEIYRSGGTFTSDGHNLFGVDGVAGLYQVTPLASDITPLPGVLLSAIIGPLANNGGPTQTLLPVVGSPAINAGDNSLIPAGVTTDQRGVARIAGGAVDIGAVEADSSTLPPDQALIESYYQTILGRTPDAAGVAYWKSETDRTRRLGLDIKDVFRVMAGIFFTSAEYLNRPALLSSGEIHLLSTNNVQYITDLYRTFFQRDPDPDGLSYWTQPLAEGLPRSMVLYNFVFSKEFDGTMQKQFGDTPARSEDATIGDFYRGYLNRLPDDDGFAFWQGRFRTAQCTNADAVRAEVESISNQFQAGTEYATRQRSPGDYVSDLYYAFLRRGGDLAGYNYWVNQISSQSATRDQVRQAFVNSSEFQTRVSQIIDQGCAP
ncbi:MAG: DUF4214 domain-containing protein [Candidatus Competibacteraceae bacterium]|nr:DUF4214 domain-containing protein [Candidatus Competibacteraceae bacterium]